MEVNRAEIDAIYDAGGRLIVTPHAVKLDGQRNVPCDLRPGELLSDFLERHVPGIHSGAWDVSISGYRVPPAMWSKTCPNHGQIISVRASVGKQVLQIVAIAVLSYFTMGAGAGWIAGTFGVAAGGAAAATIGMGMFVAGSMLINKVLGPKVSTPSSETAKSVYSLSNQRNSARAYEALPTLWGELRVTPDLASLPYAWYEGDDQYLSTILLGGINVYSAADLSVGDTPLASYEDVSVYYNGLPGHVHQDVPLYSNADAIAGGEFINGGAWITRTSSVDTKVLQLDMEGQLYDVDNKGNPVVNSVQLTIEHRQVGAAVWLPLHSTTITNARMDVLRHTFSFDVALGQYEVRAKLGLPRWNEGDGKDMCKIAWVTLKSIQADTTDYSQWGRIGIKIRATGQLSGSLDTLRATYRARPMPIWNGTSWATASTRETGLSNPGAILLQTLRGVRDPAGKLQFGFGLADALIDIEGLKAFMLHCTARGYTYDKWVTGAVSLGAFCQEVALAGMGEFTWTDGSRPTAIAVGAGQPVSGVVNMANMLKASFSVDYALSNAADGIEYQYVDRARGFETQTLRVTAPGVSTMLNPARVTGEGVTSEPHAAVMARYHLAQSLYQYKTIGYTADIEHLDYRRLSLLSVSHDLTQWGFGGRLISATRAGGVIKLVLDEPVPPLTTPFIGLRVPGERDYRVGKVQPFTVATDTITVIDPWPAGVDFPGESGANPAHDTLWCYDFKATPGYRVRVVSMEPESDLKGARISCVPEGPEFWNYVLNGVYEPAPNQSSIPQLGRPSIKNLRVVEQTHVQGDTEWWELALTWDVTGDYDHAQVWAGRDGSELRMVDGNAVASRSQFRIDGPGQWLIQVIPFNASGQAGDTASILYVTTGVALPPRNVDSFVVQEQPGGLRRYAWSWTGIKPAALAGVQIRYRAGNTPITVANWDALLPLGEANDIYSAQFESTRPVAGLWTFACRAINTAGQLSPGVLSYSVNLSDSFTEIQQPDLTPPPMVTGLAATAGLSTVMVSWNAPIYTQGHGHARTEIWAAKVVGGVVPSVAAAKKVAEGYAGPVSFSSEPATIWAIWARNVTNDGVAGPWCPLVQAETGQDVDGLLDVLEGQITQSQLHQALSSDITGLRESVWGGRPGMPALPTIPSVSLVEMAEQQYAINKQITGRLSDSAEDLLRTAMELANQGKLLRDAGIYVDPVTGKAGIYGIDNSLERLSKVSVELDAVKGEVSLRATTAYVQGEIAKAQLDPTGQNLFAGLQQQIIDVQINLSSVAGTVQTKASQLLVDEQGARLVTAEQVIDALGQSISNKVDTATFTQGLSGIDMRLGTAEQTIAALPDISSITTMVSQSAGVARDIGSLAETTLRDALNQWVQGERLDAQYATGRQEITAKIDDGLSAQAQLITELTALVNTASSSLAARITQEATASADRDKAEATLREQLVAVVQTNQTDALGAAQNAFDAAGGKGKVIYGTAAPAVADRLAQNLWIDTMGGANTPKRWNGSAWLAVTDKVATDAAAAAAAAAQSALEAKALIEETARSMATALAAEVEQRTLLAATVGSNQTAAMDAANAAATAAGNKGKVLFQSTTPAVADRLAQNLWIDTSAGGNTPKRWNGSAWVAVTDKAATDAAAAAAAAAQSANEAKGLILEEKNARADAISAEANARGLLAATVVDNKSSTDSAIETLQQTVANQEGAFAQQSNSVYVQLKRRADSLAEGQLRNTLTSTEQDQKLREQDAVVRNDISARVEAGLSSEAQARGELSARMDSAEASIISEQKARVTADSAEAYERRQLAVTLGDTVVALQQESSVRADKDGHFGSLYTVRMKLAQGGRQVVGGFGLSGTSGGESGPSIDFGVMANTFWVAAPEGVGASNIRPFVVKTASETVNGVVIPAGVYMDAAYINNLTVVWARFGTLIADSIQATKISASQLTLGDGTVGGELKSANYVEGSSGWKIKPNGKAEFADIVAQGQIYATAGAIGGAVIGASFVRSSNYSAAAGTGWQLHSNGALTVPDASITNGKIGNLAVDTLNVAGNAITFNVAAYATGTLNLGDNETPADAEIGSASIDCSGAPINVHIAFCCRPYGDIDGFKERYHQWEAELIRVKDGVETTVFRGWLGFANVRLTNTYGWGLGSIAFNRRDTPGAGVVTYRVVVRNTAGQNGLTVYHRSMIISELKK